MNILYSILSVDLDGIASNDFESAEIKLIRKGKKKTVSRAAANKQFKLLATYSQTDQQKIIDNYSTPLNLNLQ